MKRLMTRMLSVGVLVLAAGCGGSKSVDDFRAGVPDSDSASIKVPQKNGALIGATADWYKITYAATGGVNTFVVAVLDILHNVVSQPPSSHPSADVYVWGPGNGSPLDPLVYRLTVTDTGNHVYSYNLDAKGKSDPDSAFVTILSGTHTPVQANGQNDAKHGSGTFLLDWDKRATLTNPPTDDKGRKLQGTWDVTYDHKTADAAVDVNFNNILNDQNQATNATYHFRQAAGADGLFQFSTDGDVNNDTTTPVTEEHIDIESRWHQDGSGRSDIKITQGDVPAGQSGTGSQCWDSNFLSVYETISLPNATGGTTDVTAQGSDATKCGFATAEYYGG